MKLSLYNSLLTNKRTMLVASIGRCGHAGYREIQVRCITGRFHWIITDGYNTIKIGHHDNSLKSALNIAEGYCKSL
jgi:hypothetical protein